MEQVFSEYLKNVKSIVNSEIDSNIIKEIFFQNLNKTPPHSVKGIIVGYFPFELPKLSHGLFFSTGQGKRSSDEEEEGLQTQMLQELQHFQRNQTILWLRIPHVMSTTRGGTTERLITAFVPVLRCILQKIIASTGNGFESPIPVLCLGKNSFLAVSESLMTTTRPKFIVLSTVHPNHMKTIDETITKTTSNTSKLRQLRHKYYFFDMFMQIMSTFAKLVK